MQRRTYQNTETIKFCLVKMYIKRGNCALKDSKLEDNLLSYQNVHFKRPISIDQYVKTENFWNLEAAGRYHKRQRI